MVSCNLMCSKVLPVLPLPSCHRSTVDMALTHRIVAHWAGCDPHSCWQGSHSHPGTLLHAAGNLLHMCWSTVVTKREEYALSNGWFSQTDAQCIGVNESQRDILCIIYISFRHDDI